MTKIKIKINGKEKEVLHSYGQNPDVTEEERINRFKTEAMSYNSAVDVLGEETKKFYFCSEYNPFDFPDKYNRIKHCDTISLIENKSKILLDK